jgi:two-component system, LuxR family, response regulator FixJ
MANAPTVFVVDDDPGALRSLCWLIQQAGLPVRAFRSGREFLDSYPCQDPGCLVLDVQMPEMGGLELQQHLSEHSIGLPIIFITAHGDVPTCAQALKGGALDFLEKPVDGEVFLDRVRKALTRGTEQKERQKFAAEIAARMSRLTPREKEVLDLLLSGKTLKEIAALSNVRIETVWKHRVSIFRKMRAENDVELVRLVTEWTNEQRR